MPELPEVETVRLGLDRFVVGATIAGVEVRHPRSIRRHLPGAADFTARLTGMRIAAARRRGKYLWLPLEPAADAPARLAAGADPGTDPGTTVGGGEALIAHLGMSGQLLVRPATAPDERHLHVRIEFDGDGRQLRFVDQRTFGGLMLDALEPSRDLATDLVPSQVAHIARDPIDPQFDDEFFVRRLRTRRTEVKRALLDQSLVSGIGNIYADEALWRAKLSGLRIASSLAPATVRRLLACVREVLDEALLAGGTSFDSMYVNVNGESGYFSRSLAVYGREGQPCERCGRAIRRSAFMNRSSFSCPGCQPRPRVTGATLAG